MTARTNELEATPVAVSPRTSPPFWAWSVAIYLRPVVADHCLALQDECGADVNLLLWCAWMAVHYEAPAPPALLREAIALVEPVVEGVTRPLRAARRKVKELGRLAEDETRRQLRTKILDAELDAERVEQALLDRLAMARLGPPAEIARPPGEIRAVARANLAAYAGLIGLDAESPALGQRLVSLVNAIV